MGGFPWFSPKHQGKEEQGRGQSPGTRNPPKVHLAAVSQVLRLAPPHTGSPGPKSPGDPVWGGHLRPVILKPVGRIFEISDSSPIRGKCGQCGRASHPRNIPSDTKLLLTKNYSKIIIFEKLRISRVIPRKSPSFPKILRVQTRLKITKNNSQGIIFVIISCQKNKGLRRFRGAKRRRTWKMRKMRTRKRGKCGNVADWL